MSDNIKVVVKVRPLIPREIEDKLSFQWRVKNNTLYQLDQKDGRDFGQVFTFDKVYDQDTKTSDVYNDVAKPIVEAATAGFNGTIFAYGQTSSGKTYTMTGTEQSPGIIPLAVLNLFEIIKNIPNRDFLVRVSYIEIYNETLKDLLDLERENVKVHETLQGIKVDATEKVTSSPEEVLDIMKKGEANRQTGSTNMNEASSRSHSIFQITIESREHIEGEEQAGCVNVSQLNLVDLAGSERAGQTGATGLRFKEGTHINKSLSVLALVIKQLSEGPNKHANYRDSKLTRILQNSLGGNAKTSIICAVTLAAVEETISTLQFANRAKAIENKPEVNAVATDATMIQRLTKQLSKLQSQLETKKNLEVMLESKKNVEQDNYNLQKQIAALQRLILNGFAQRRSVEFTDGARRKLQQQRRVTISTLHSIEDVPAPSVVKFRTPALKYNLMSIPNPSDFVPIQNPSKLETLPEETSNRLVTPPPMDRRVNFSDEIIKLDSDDDDDSSNVLTCSPYHKCYDSSKTPPCILRKNAKQAEKNFQDIVELTEREKIYSPSVVELIKKIENHTNVIAHLQEEVDNLSKQSNDKDFEMDQLKNKIKKAEEEVQSINSVKMELEAQCCNFNTKLTDWEVSYETLKKKSKLREEELLSMLDEKNNKYRNPENICKTLSKTIDKELTQFMDMSKDISLVNSDNECSIANPDEEASALIQDIVIDLQAELTLKNQNLLELEANIYAHKQKILSLENSTQELQEMVSKFQEKLEIIESENALLKSTVDNLNTTVQSQRVNLETANSDIESYNNVIQELQNKLTAKEKINIDDNFLESLKANEQNIIANNENIKNIIHSLKNTLDARNEEIYQLKSTLKTDNESTIDSNSLKEQIESKTKQVNSLNEEVNILRQQLCDNITTINKLMLDKNNFDDMERELALKLTELEKNNIETNIALDDLKKNHNKLLDTIKDKDLKEQEISRLNEDYIKKIEEMNSRINNLEIEVTHKENYIVSLKKEDDLIQHNLDRAKSSVIKLKEILTLLTDEIHEVPAEIDSFIFGALNDSLNTLETKVIKVVAEKDRAVHGSIELKNELMTTINKHNIESSSLNLQIDNLTKTANTLYEQNENLTKELKELTLQLDQIHCAHSEEQNEELVNLRDNAIKNHEELLSKNNTIALLKNNECTLRSEIDLLLQNGDQKCEHLQIEIENLCMTLKSKEEEFSNSLREKEKIISDLKLSLSDTETELKEKHKDLEIKFQKLLKTSQGTDILMTNILKKVTQITGDFHIENNLSCDFENININVYEEIILTLDKIVNHMTVINSGCDDAESNLESILVDAKKEIRELTQQNLKLMTLLSEIENKNHDMSLEIVTIQNENQSFKESLLKSHSLLEQLKIELKAKAEEIEDIEMKMRDWKDQYLSLDLIMKQQMEEIQLENDQLKTKYLKLQMETTHHYDDLTDDQLSDIEYYQDKNRKHQSTIDKTIEPVLPPSLLTLCCNKIINTIQPSETDTKSVTTSSSSANIERQSVETQCNILSSELSKVKYENSRLAKIAAELEHANQQLLHEQDEVRKEVKLLMAPAIELHKKLVNHNSNLSKLTATAHAENKSLRSQVKILQHDNSRYHNVCQRDIPAFKIQLEELMKILRQEQIFININNLNFKRYSLPDELDHNTTLANFKNESTLDGDLLMMDTNVTMATADTTLMGHEQTCLDLTLYNEACQTNDLNQTTNQNMVCSQVEILNSNYHNMLARLNILKHKLRAQMDKNANAKEPKIDANCSPIKFNNSFTENSQNKKVNDSKNKDFICEKCSSVEELRLEHANLTKELNTLSQELIDVRAQKEDFEKKYKYAMLEMPATDALVTKLNALEKDFNGKVQENSRLTATLHKKTMEVNQLQEENDLLSNQVMDNISEADNLNKELEKFKEINVDLTEKYNKLNNLVNETHSRNKVNVSINCPQCATKDVLINSLHTKGVPESHSKLNRSFSDSETSSRFNKICTLQNELDAGRADCKELTEEVATIKNQIERRNLSMDLDDSMGDSNLFGLKSLDTANSQYNKCNMLGIPEELPLDVYKVDKIDCLNYYTEQTGADKESLNYDVKIIDVLKMLHNKLLTKHANEVENLINRLRDFEEAKNILLLQINNMASEYSKTKNELDEKNEYFTKIATVLAQIKNNTNILNKEANNTETDNTTKLVTSFKENLLKILDKEFVLSSGNVFDSLINSIVNKHQNELMEVTDQYTKLQEHMENVTMELNSVNDSLTQMKSQLSDKENEYNLLKLQKERVHEISKAVTFDVIKKEHDLSKAITEGCQKLLEHNIIHPGDIDMTSPLNKNISLLFEYLINQHKKICNPEIEKEKELLVLEISNSKTIIEDKQKQLDDIRLRNEKMQEINSSITFHLVDKEKKLETLKTLHEDLNKIYESKVEENKANLSLIEKLTQEINILKDTMANKDAIVQSLQNDLEAQEHERMTGNNEKINELFHNIKALQENIEYLKGVNEMIIKEKEITAIELQKSNETIKRNNTDLDKMTSDILILRESVKENTAVVENLKLEAKSLLKQNLDLKEQLEIKCQDCSRLETNIRTHEKTAEIQSKMIIRLQKQKEEDSKSKDKHLEELTAKWIQVQNECDVLQNNFKDLKIENDALKLMKQSLEARVSELETEVQSCHKPRTSLDAIADTSRRRRQSLHDSKRMFAEDKLDFDDHNIDEVFQSRTKADDLFMDVDDNASDRSTPIRMSRGRDSLLSRTDQSDKDEEHPSRPSSVLATRRRRQSTHDLHRTVSRHTPSPHDGRLLEENNHLKQETGSNRDNSELLQLKQQLSCCQQELEDLKEKYRELDDECETCSEYLRERDEQCKRLKKDKAALENTVKELKDILQSSNPNKSQLGDRKRSVADVSVNTDEDWANLHSVVVDRMSYDAEVEKTKRLTKTIEELRFKNQELKNTMAKMQKALEKNSGRYNNRELEATKLELQSCKEELADLRQRYKELDEECETCSEYLRERDEQCRALKEAKLALEAKLEELQDDDSVGNILQSVRKKRQSSHDQNRTLAVDLIDASTETSDDFLSYQVERDNSSQRIAPEAQSKEIKRLKMAVDKLSQQKAALENQLVTSGPAAPMYVATGSAIVQNQQITDVMKENQYLKKMNAKLIKICQKRGKESNRENIDPAEQG